MTFSKKENDHKELLIPSCHTLIQEEEETRASGTQTFLTDEDELEYIAIQSSN